MERIFLTEDGSHSLFSNLFNQQYHSVDGALSESVHIYIELGLRPVLEKSIEPIHIFEMGFGTGLDALLAWQLADQLQKPVYFTTIEGFPVLPEEASLLNYESLTGHTGFMKLHQCSWEVDHQLSPYFNFRKENVLLQNFETREHFDVIFFDAFDPRVQPELWTEEVFSKIASMTRDAGVLVTYSSKGTVKRALADAGFSVRRHPGPGKKTHVLKAIREK